MIFLLLFYALSMEIKPDSSTVGDSLTLKIRGRLPDSISIILPDSFPDILVLNPIKKINDTLAIGKIVSFSTGSQDLKLKINEDTLKLSYFVKSVLTENKNLSPIWGPYGFFNWLYLLWLLIIPFGLGFYFFVKLKKKEEGLIEKEEISPKEEALKNLEFLMGKVNDWDWNKLYTSLSYISRRYMERKLNIPAVEATTSELIPLIKKGGYTPFFPLIKEFPEWDLIKFADEKSTPQEFENDVLLVKTAILEIEKEEERNDSFS
ncbi:MAG: hypothetical protein ABIN61_08490 [candidate division WOR-3 bacterium]